MEVYMADCPYRQNELYHHGVKGQRWGIRRYQNSDGTLTDEGRRRYGKSIERGERILNKGRGTGTSIGLGVARQVGIEVGTGIASGIFTAALLATPVGALSASAMMAGSMAISGLHLGTSVANIVTTIKDVQGVQNALISREGTKKH